MDVHDQTIKTDGDSHGWHQVVLQSAMDGYWMTDTRGRLLEVNESYCRMSGYSRQELLELQIADLEAIETADQAVARIHKIMKLGNDRFESLHRRKDGTFFPVEISVQYLPAEGGSFVVFVRDITERKQLEKNLRDQRRRLESIIEGERVGTWEWNIETGETVFNETWARMIGYTLVELAPTSFKTWERFVHPDDLRESNRMLGLHLAGDTPYYECECRMRHKAGHWVWINDRGRVLSRTEDGKPLMMFGTHAEVTERKRSEQILKEREERIREVLENSLDASYKRNLKTNSYEYFSPVIKRISGYTAEEMKLMPLETALGLIHPDDMDGVQRVMASTMSEAVSRARQVQYRFRHKDGQYRWFLDQFSVLRDERGQPAALIGSVSDVTARRQAEEKLAQEAIRRRILVEQSRDGIVVLDQDGKVYEANQRYAEMLGYTAEEVRELYVWDWDLQWSRDELKEMIRSVGPAGDHFETRHRRKDGTYFDVEVSANGAVIGGRKLVFCVCRDITERKKAEVALTESLAQYRQLFEMGSDAFFLIDPETGKILDANVAATELYGYRLEEMVTKRSWDMSAEPEETSRLTQEMQNSPEMIMRIPLRYHRKKDGTAFPVEIAARSFPLQGKRALIVSARDIGERMENEKQLRRMQKTESMQRMASAIAHHFNNQLGTVMGNLELANIQVPRGAQTHDCLNAAMEATRRAAKVSSLMLTYLGQTRDEPEPIDLSEACRLNIPLIQAIQSSNAVFETILPTSGPTVNSTSSHIQLALTVLLTNAWEALPEGHGRIHLAVQSVPAKEIPATNRYPLDWQPQDTSYGCLEVSDTGFGISSEGFEKLFDPFYSTKFVGRGLGLPTVLGVVRADGGGITVQSVPGQGSAFRVYFPLLEGKAPQQPEKAPGLQGPLMGGAVLLIEDDDMLRKTTASMLSLLGFSVVEAQDGVEAIEVFRKRHGEIRAVVCDLTMPRLDGRKTVAALREIAGDIPAILTSGYHESIAKAPDLPGVILSKPCGLSELRAAIVDAMAKKS